VPTITDVGVTRWTYFRTLQVEMDPAWSGFPTAGWYRVWRWAWHRQGETAGAFDCSRYGDVS
jgi:hypothetical protein